MSDYQKIERVNDFNSVSRYGNNAIYRSMLDEFLETYVFKDIPISESDVYVVIDSGWQNRIDLIAYEFYKNPDLWWVIAMANNITNPMYLEVGTRIRIPGLNTLWGYRGLLMG